MPSSERVSSSASSFSSARSLRLGGQLLLAAPRADDARSSDLFGVSTVAPA
jgi:hypothetical protein